MTDLNSDAQVPIRDMCGPAEDAVRAVLKDPRVTNFDTLVHEIVDAVRPHLAADDHQATTDPLTARWRTGRHVGRTVYAQIGPDPTRSDVLIGTLDTPELAQAAVRAHNAALAARTLHVDVRVPEPDHTEITEICVYGASDDLIETRGAVDEEYNAVYDGPTTVIVHAKTGGELVQVRLRVEYSPDGTGEWRITELAGHGLVTIVPARGEDEGDDEDDCPGYSEKAIVRGGYAVELEGNDDE